MYRVLFRGIAEALCAQLGDWGFAVRPWRISAM